VHPQLDRIVSLFDQSLCDSESPEYLERARLDGKRARLVHGVHLTIHDPGSSAERVELRRKREAGGPRADDEGVIGPAVRAIYRLSSSLFDGTTGPRRRAYRERHGDEGTAGSTG
jgi:hypothetical protein